MNNLILAIIVAVMGTACSGPEYYPQREDVVEVTWERTIEILKFYKCENIFVVLSMDSDGMYNVRSLSCSGMIEAKLIRHYLKPL